MRRISDRPVAIRIDPSDVWAGAGRSDGSDRRTTMAIEIRTDEFELSHGKAPRGYGHWGFAEDPR
jgi:hypothetical protein